MGPLASCAMKSRVTNLPERDRHELLPAPLPILPKLSELRSPGLMRQETLPAMPTTTISTSLLRSEATPTKATFSVERFRSLVAPPIRKTIWKMFSCPQEFQVGSALRL